MSVEILAAAIDTLAALDDDALGSAELVVALSQQLSRLDAVACRQAEVVGRGAAWRAVGARTSADWVGVEAGIDRRVAHRRWRVGQALAVCEPTASVLAAGAITVEHVEVLWRARNRNRITVQAYARDETILLGWATSEVFEDFRILIEAWVLAVDTHDAERRAERQFERRRLHLSESLDGQWFVDGELDPVSGDSVALVLDRIVAELYAADRAEARARLGDDLRDSDLRDSDLRDSDLARTPGQRRADALVEMARRAGTVPANGKAPRPLVTIHVGEAAFATMCRLSSGRPITPGAAARVLDDAVIERVIFDAPDRVRSVSHRRAYRDALRRAVEVKQTRCGHRYCRRRVELCEADHIEPHGRGGLTSEENGRLLCGFHNRLRNIHDDG